MIYFEHNQDAVESAESVGIKTYFYDHTKEDMNALKAFLDENLLVDEIKQTIVIDRSAHEVFDFTLNPENTPKWIDSIVEEQTNEAPTKLGTIYKNRSPEGIWNEYEVTAFEPDTMFVFSRKNGTYHVKYTFTSLGESQCELEYCEWDENNDHSQLFTEADLKKVLQKLKNVIEG